MDIACAGSWSEAVLTWGGNVVGRLPYRIQKKPFGVTVLDMPTLVHTLGPVVAPEFAGANFPRSLKEVTIIRDLLAQLPKASHIVFRLHGGITNTLAFEAAGFTTCPNYTVEIKPDTADVLWRQMRDKTRNSIRRAQERLHIEVSTDVETFIDFYVGNLQYAGRNSHYDRALSLRLVSECLKRGVGRILVAKGENDQIQAGIFTMWDSTKEYYFMSTRRQDSINGAVSLLIWEALQHASQLGLILDMDGIHVVNEGIPNLLLLTGFGGILTPRYVVQRSSRWIHLAGELRDVFTKCFAKSR
jgi:hypothetical protein